MSLGRGPVGVIDLAADNYAGRWEVGCSREAVEFKLAYLETVKRLLDEQKTANGFASALKDAFPALAGEEGVSALAGALYKE